MNIEMMRTVGALRQALLRRRPPQGQAGLSAEELAEIQEINDPVVLYNLCIAYDVELDGVPIPTSLSSAGDQTSEDADQQVQLFKQLLLNNLTALADSGTRKDEVQSMDNAAELHNLANILSLDWSRLHQAPTSSRDATGPEDAAAHDDVEVDDGGAEDIEQGGDEEADAAAAADTRDRTQHSWRASGRVEGDVAQACRGGPSPPVN
ncbi:hypothetical protein ABBQ38_006818 [Trebouxia sp. C0009 RCD-2024]